MVDLLLGGVREGRSGVLVVRGEAGIGKTELLNHAGHDAAGFRILHVTGVEAEAGFAFAGLHQLCTPVLECLGGLPEPQRNAIDVALGRRGGVRPDPFFVGLATLALLAEAAEERPVLCLVDDAQWLDAVSLQVLSFVARRLDAEPLALVFGVRHPAAGHDPVPALMDLPGVELAGLSDEDAHAVLATAVHYPLEAAVRDRIVAEAHGNPLALLELARQPGPAALAGGFGLPDALSVPDRVEESFRMRATGLPAAAQLALLVAAAEPLGDVALFTRACDHLGLNAGDVEPAQAAGLVEIDTGVRFAHPLARAAAYGAALAADRRRAHHAIATATDPRIDPDRHTWHQAQSVVGTDEPIAAELQVAAARARARGGPGAAAAFLERSAVLTPDAAARAQRTLAAARAWHEAGDSDTAARLLATAAPHSLDEAGRARAALLHAMIALHTNRGSDVPGKFLRAAELLAPHEAALSREATLHAVEAAMLVGRFGSNQGVNEVARAALAAPAAPDPPRPLDHLLDGLVTYFAHGYPQAVTALRRAVDAHRAAVASDDDVDVDRWWLFCHAALGLWDADAARALTDRFVRHARDQGILTRLPFALNAHSVVLMQEGGLVRAAELIDESDAITRATRGVPVPHGRLLLAAWRGQETEAVALYRASVEDGTRRGEGTSLTIADSALAVLHNGLGNYSAALEAAESVRDSGELVHTAMVLPELVEAAVRSNQTERANSAVTDLTMQARVTAAPWARGLEARSRALVTDGDHAEPLFRDAIADLGNAGITAQLARTHLLFGEWLRRSGRRRDAREQLRTAHEMLSGMGVDGFAARAAAELRATGEQPRVRSAQSSDALTPQELRIARLVATGATSKEVAAQLFLSPRTIDAHLRSIFPKLGITSRRQLRDLRLG